MDDFLEKIKWIHPYQPGEKLEPKKFKVYNKNKIESDFELNTTIEPNGQQKHRISASGYVIKKGGLSRDKAEDLVDCLNREKVNAKVFKGSVNVCSYEYVFFSEKSFSVGIDKKTLPESMDIEAVENLITKWYEEKCCARPR